MVDEQAAEITATRVRVKPSELTVLPTRTAQITAALKPLEGIAPPLGELRRAAVVADLIPISEADATPFTPFFPPFKPFAEFDPVAAPSKTLVVDIETTGLKANESRLMVIGFLDPNDPEGKPVVLFSPDEEELLRQFMDFYETRGFDSIIAYHASFDFAYLFQKCLRYRIPCPGWANSKLRDVMQLLTQVKEAFVYKPGKDQSLNNWATYLLGEGKLAEIDQLFEWWEKGQIQEIMDYNVQDVLITWKLWQLVQFSKGAAVSAPTFLLPSNPSNPNNVENSVICSRCLQEAFFAEGETQKKCEVCGLMLSAPVE